MVKTLALILLCIHGPTQTVCTVMTPQEAAHEALLPHPHATLTKAPYHAE